MVAIFQTIFLGTVVGALLTTLVVALCVALTDPSPAKDELNKHRL
jgi:hypothetical protein